MKVNKLAGYINLCLICVKMETPLTVVREEVEDNGFISLGDTSESGESDEDLFSRLMY
jgi:hypothetical protein